MAFTSDTFVLCSKTPLFKSKANLWLYKTDDDVETILTAGYFVPRKNKQNQDSPSIGDLIQCCIEAERIITLVVTAVSEKPYYITVAKAQQQIDTTDLLTITNDTLDGALTEIDEWIQLFNSSLGLGGDLTAHDFTTYSPTQEDLTEWAMKDIWGAGTFVWNAGNPAASTLTVTETGKVYSASQIFNKVQVHNTYTPATPDPAYQDHWWRLTNTQSTDPTVFWWTDIGSQTMQLGNETFAGSTKLYNSAAGEGKTDGAYTANESDLRYPSVDNLKSSITGTETDNNLLASIPAIIDYTERFTIDKYLVTCATAAATTIKDITIDNMVLTAGTRFKVKFSFGNSSNTVQIRITKNSVVLGTYDVYDESGTIVSATQPAYFPSGSTINFYYDGTNVYYKRLPIKRYRSGTTKYTLYNDGYVEQMGQVEKGSNLASGGNWDGSITFPITMSSTNYIPLHSLIFGSETGGGEISYNTLTTTGCAFRLYNRNSSAVIVTPILVWKIEGYAA